MFSFLKNKLKFSHRLEGGGFTLIELLVVIAIIGMLSSIVLVSLNTARSKARDVSRKVALKQIKNALEFYYDSNGAYPNNGFVWHSSEQGDVVESRIDWIPGLVPTYISSLPKDPRGGASLIWQICVPPWKSAFLYISNGTDYKLLSHCAPENPWTSSDSFYDPARPTWAWMICSGEPACSSW